MPKTVIVHTGTFTQTVYTIRRTPTYEEVVEAMLSGGITTVRGS